MIRRRLLATATGGVLLATALSGCSLLRGGDTPVPEPSRTATVENGSTDHHGGGDAHGSSKTASLQPPSVAAGTIGAETDLTSPSGKTAVHVKVVSDGTGAWDVLLSDYRTTNPQAMTIEFRSSVPKPSDGYDVKAWGQDRWTATAGAPDSYSMSDAGARPDFLRSVVLVPTQTEPSDTDPTATSAPWQGHVLAVAPLTWHIPPAYSALHLTMGAARPGAYGLVIDANGRPAEYLVAHGDDQTTVAARFGITIAQLRWLDPTIRTHGDGWLFEDDKINIDPQRRVEFDVDHEGG
ncbi:hypothetical protein [Curtobacterium sp. L1-20]|uniref:hypothetical protein n=1 Tax=Curtobacterium sp. L1-20 TaxID=3138181 RepID=UPI003B51924C